MRFLLWLWNLSPHVKAIIALLLVALAIIGYVFYLKMKVHNAEKRGQDALGQQGQIHVDEAKANANAASNVSNQSLANANAARAANINSFNSNYNEARKNYCVQFPQDCQ